MGTIAEKGEYLNNTKLLLKQKINNLGGSIDEQTTFREYTDELQDVYDNLPKTTGESTEVSLNTVKGRMQITEKGNTIQDGTPSPNNEVPIKVVTGENTVTRSGKNYINLDESESGGIDANGGLVSNVQNWRSSNYISVKPNTNYTFSFTVSSIPTYRLRLYQYDSNKTFISPRTEGAFNSSVTLTTGDSTYYLKWTIYVENTTLTKELVTSYKPMIAKGSDTTFEPYISPISKQLDLGDIELCKIGTVNDVLFHAVSGDKYYDSLSAEDKALLDVGDWYKHEKIKNITFNGTESWNFVSLSDRKRSYISISDIVTNIEDSDITPMVCTNFINTSYSLGQASGQPVNVITGRKGIAQINIFHNIADNNAGFLTWLSNNTPSVLYPLALPTFNKITDTTLINQLNAIDNLMSNNGTTIISTSAESGNANLILDVTAIGTSSTQPTGTISITTNGSHNVTNYATANVNVTPATETKTVKSTTTSQTINPTSGKLISQITVQPITLDTVNVTPSTSSQTVTPTHDGIGTVNVSAVTSSIDNNIVAGNIKKDVSILGVTGTYEGSGGTFVVPNGMKFRDSTLSNFPTIDTSNVTDFGSFFRSCSNIVTLPNINVSNGIVFTYFCTSCGNLENVPVLDISYASNVTNMFSSCSKLSNTSLNNIMASLLEATEYSGVKTLKTVGLSSTQATTCTSLSNWTALSAAGWTTGY